MSQKFDPMIALKEAIEPISERELMYRPSSGVRAISTLLGPIEYDERETLLKRSVIQLINLDLQAIDAALSPTQAAQAYLAANHTWIRLARVLIKEGVES